MTSRLGELPPSLGQKYLQDHSPECPCFVYAEKCCVNGEVYFWCRPLEPPAASAAASLGTKKIL